MSRIFKMRGIFKFIIIFFAYFYPLASEENLKILNLKNAVFYLPERYKMIFSKENFYFFESSANSIFFIYNIPAVQKIEDISINLIPKLKTSQLLAKEGFYLYFNFHHSLQSSLSDIKEIGCLDQKLNQCYEIINYFYKTSEITFDFITEKSYDLEKFSLLILNEIYNFPYSEKKIYKKFLDHYLHFRIRWNFLENEEGNQFLMGIITTPDHYNQHYLEILEFLNFTNIIPQKRKTRLVVEKIQMNLDKEIQILMIVDNNELTNFLLEEVKNKIEYLFQIFDQFNQNFKIFISGTNKPEILFEFHQFSDFKKEFNLITTLKEESSCLSIAEDLNGNDKDISTICVTNKWDDYLKLKNKPWKEHLLFTKNLPFYSLFPDEDHQNDKKCTGNYKKFNIEEQFHPKFSGYEKIFFSNTCNLDYAPFFIEVGFHMMKNHSPIKLNYIPIGSSIKIKYENQTLTGGKEISKENIFFVHTPNDNKLILGGDFLKLENQKIIIEYLTYEN